MCISSGLHLSKQSHSEMSSFQEGYSYAYVLVLGTQWPPSDSTLVFSTLASSSTVPRYGVHHLVTQMGWNLATIVILKSESIKCQYRSVSLQ